jgi:dolichol-phosphate mannosyltransferase
MNKSSVCVVIPMYNEEKNADKCVRAVMNEILKIKNKTGLVIVDGASTDNTKKILLTKKKKFNKLFYTIFLKNNSGYGGALRAGTKMAKSLGYNYVLFMDSDLTNNPKDILKFVKKAATGIDCVKASRYTEGGKMQGVPLYRQIISFLGNLIARCCFRVGLYDYTNGFRMIKLQTLRGIEFREKGFAFIMEEMYQLKRNNARFAYIPVTLTSRTTTQTHFPYTWKTFYSYVKYCFKAALII